MLLDDKVYILQSLLPLFDTFFVCNLNWKKRKKRKKEGNKKEKIAPPHPSKQAVKV